MTQNKTKVLNELHSFLNIAQMRFRPQKLIQQQQKATANASILNRITSALSFHTTSTRDQSIQDEGSIVKLKFIEKLSGEFFLLGNQNQIDLISFGRETSPNIDTQFIWSLYRKKPIDQICVDAKKSYLALMSGGQIFIYKYDLKRLDAPRQIMKLQKKTSVKFIQFPKESLLACFYEFHFEVYAINEEQIKLRYNFKYDVQSSLQIYQIPMAHQQTINVFFLQERENISIATLWCLQIHFVAMDLHIQPLQKIYDIKKSLKKSLRMNNYSKQIFLMNLGPQILAVKKGYIIDSVNVNLLHQNSALKYIGNDRLLHITDKKVEVYRFTIDRNAKPQRISCRAIDSIKIKKPQNAILFHADQVLGNNFSIFYQLDPSKNPYGRGQTVYWLTTSISVSLEDKLNEIFPKSMIQEYQKNQQLLAQKCDMAQKMGLSSVEIFLQLWNKTSRCTLQDYNLLLRTKDYRTIKNEIQRKLKKNSMSFKQVYAIEQRCFLMLRDELFSVNCNQQIIINYISSHFWKRKLQLFKEIELYRKKMEARSPELRQKKVSKNASVDEENQKMLMINIQQYYTFKRNDIKAFMIELVSAYCHDNKPFIYKIRILLTTFRFVFRTIYKDLLNQIMICAKNKLLKLLQDMPELLPYYPDYNGIQQSEDSYMKQGIWPNITNKQWEGSLYEDMICTIDNREIVEQFVNNVWFKRNWLSKHDLITHSKDEIIRLHQVNKSNYLFYFFISKLFQLYPEPQDQAVPAQFDSQTKVKVNRMRSDDNNIISNSVNRERSLSGMSYAPKAVLNSQAKVQSSDQNKNLLIRIVKHIEVNYNKTMPSHLTGKTFLYYKLFNFLKENQILPENKGSSFVEFLDLKYPELFKHFFKKERNQKGLILKKIKPIFQKNDSKGTQNMFNEALYAYFQSDLSQVSDLKYILNRINNEKKDFHQANQSMYQVLIDAMLMKLKLGSEDDIPIEEVLIYIENIPLSRDNKLTKRILFIEEVRIQAQRFRKMKLNMSILEILNCRQDVIKAMVLYDMQASGVLQMNNWQQFIKTTYQVLAQVQTRKERLYDAQDHFLPFFVFLCRILQEKDKIPLAIRLLKDPYLAISFSVDTQTQQNLVLYMYRWKFDKDPIYVNNQSYINELMKILPEQSDWRIFLKCEIEFAVMLSFDKQYVEYPLTVQGTVPSINQFQEQISTLPASKIVDIDLSRIYELMSSMERLIYSNIPVSVPNAPQLALAKMVTPRQIYEAIIIRLLELGQLKKLIAYIKEVLTIETDEPEFNIVYLLMYIMQIIEMKELTIDCNELLSKCVFFYFEHPMKLIDILQELQTEMSNEERYQFLQHKLEMGKKLSKGYNRKNSLFSKGVQMLINKHGSNYDLNKMIDRSIAQVKSLKEEFEVKIIYSMIFKTLCYFPDVLIKLIYIKKADLNFQYIRLFFTYIITYQIFDPRQLVTFYRKLFISLYEAHANRFPIETVISGCKNIEQNNYGELQWEVPTTYFDIFQEKFVKSAQFFKRKKEQLQSKSPRVKSNPNAKQDQQIMLPQFEKLMTVDASRNNIQYQFIQDDDNRSLDTNFLMSFQKRKKTKKHKQFNSKIEMNKMIQKKQTETLGGKAYQNVKQESHFLRSTAMANSSAFTNSIRMPSKNQFNAPLRFGNNLNIEESCMFKSRRFDPIASQRKKTTTSDSKKPPAFLNSQHLEDSQIIEDDDQKEGYLQGSRNHLKVVPNKERIATYDYIMPHSAFTDHSVSYNQENQEQSSQNQTSNFDRLPQPPQIAHNRTVSSVVNQSNADVSRGKSQQNSRNQSNQKDSLLVIKKLYAEEESLDNQRNIKLVVQQLLELNKQLLSEKKSQNKFNLSVIDKIIQLDNFASLGKAVASSIYQNKQFALDRLLYLIEQLAKNYPLGIQTKYLEIYQRAQSIRTKYTLQLDIRQIFPIQALFSEQSSIQKLYQQLKPHFLLKINEINIYKTVKVVSLAFKMVKLEQDLHFSYLKGYINDYVNNQQDTDFKMQGQKIGVLIDKIKPEFMFQKFEQLFSQVKNGKKKDYAINIAVNSIKKRGKNIDQNEIEQKKLLVMKSEGV